VLLSPAEAIYPLDFHENPYHYMMSGDSPGTTSFVLKHPKFKEVASILTTALRLLTTGYLLLTCFFFLPSLLTVATAIWPPVRTDCYNSS